MIQPRQFFEALNARGISLYAGVPDSLLANFCAYIDEHASHNQHLITANEGNAVAIAMGYYLATGQVAAVYMQNSGLGNTVNPLVSLVDPEVYNVPMLLIIGWRGEPGVTDEPQHVKQGRITLEQLDVLEIPYWVVDAGSDVIAILDAAIAAMAGRNAPVALVVRKDTFAKYTPKRQILELSGLVREAALEQLLALCDKDDLVVSTTGKTSREVFELRASNGQAQRDFLTVGGMGHTSSISLGVAIGQPSRRVICLDGDGSLLMHMGAMPIIAACKPRRFIHVLLNNGAHDSVGGQSTVASDIDFARLADSVGYVGYAEASDVGSLIKAWDKLTKITGPVLLEIKIRKGSREDLGRPTNSTVQNKLAFMEAAGAR
jgi:phosphonopyruvate decarboxylase